MKVSPHPKTREDRKVEKLSEKIRQIQAKKGTKLKPKAA
jgi:hypothetical protein